MKRISLLFLLLATGCGIDGLVARLEANGFTG